jgi:hypothetical protein
MTTYTVTLSQVGTQGAPGANWRGVWALATTYAANDVVRSGNDTYICILSHTSSATDEPGVGANTATYWALFAQGGTDGTDGVDGDGFTGGSYDAGTGVVTFASDDGLGFSTGDLRGADGADGLGFTGGSYDAGTGVVTFASDDGLGFVTGDLRGAAGADGESFTWEGSWLTATSYAVNDVVENDGSSYICILDHTSSATDEPGAGANTATYWELVAQKGVDGIGAGTVTSIDVAGGTGIDSTGGPITSSGTITVALDAATIASLDLADTATQPGDLATVATTGAYSDLSGLPTLGTAAATDATDYATAAQGDLADTALQSVTGTLDEIVVTGGDTISLAAAVTTSLGLADSAVQPGDLATVATTGAYNDLSGTPTLGTMAAEAAADYLAVAGDAMTGDLTVLGVIETEDASSATTYAMDPTTNGTRATLTLTAATTLTDSLSDGEHISLRIIDGDTHAVTWVAGTLWVGGSAPTLTGDDRVTFEKWGTDLIGYTGLGIA